MGSTKAFLIGAGTAYLFDPQQGRRRRRILRDRGARLVRRADRIGRKKARFALGRLRGLLARSRRVVSQPDALVDDASLAQRIRSDAFRGLGLSARDVELRVQAGIATLRGSVTSRPQADDLVERVGKIPGVRDVAAMLRVESSDATRVS